MRDIAQVEIKGLFGYIDHFVKFSTNSPITILTGPNGSGKTHLLRVLHAVATFDLEELASVDFREVRIDFRDNRALKVIRQGQNENTHSLKFSGRIPPSRNFKTLTVEHTRDEDNNPTTPPWVVQLPSGDWYDTRTGRQIPPETAKRRFNAPEHLANLKTVREPWLDKFYDNASAILIDTQRLDNSDPKGSTYGRGVSRHPQSRVQQYSGQVAAQVSEARRTSLNESLDADQSFAARMLRAGETNVQEKELKERYQRIADQHAELHASGLSVAPVDVAFPDQKTTAIQRSILNVFLDDWERKLQPLLPIHEKLRLLRKIVESKFTGKALELTPQGRLRFRSTHDSKLLPMHALSSGEQHLLAVFTLLLFSSKRGTLVLVDEPEISMHAAWKHAFLEDIEEVARISDLQIILATHSSSIIRGQWDLVQEISVPDFAHTGQSGDEEDDSAFEGMDVEA
ncbi:AAA family ATPase [Streptomyces sp. NPDC003952]